VLHRHKEAWKRLTESLQRTALPQWTLDILVCNAATQPALQLQQERIQVVRSNKVVRRIPTELNGTPAMNLGFEDIRRYANNRGRKLNTHP